MPGANRRSGNPVGDETETEHHRLDQLGTGIDRLHVSDRQFASLHARDIASRYALVDRADPTDRAVRSRPDAEIGAVTPVNRIVSRTIAAGSCPVGELVLVITVLLELFHRQFSQLGHDVVVEGTENAPAHSTLVRGSGLDRQGVEREMLRLPGEDRGEVLFPLVWRLTWPPVDQVEVDVAEASGSSGPVGGYRRLGTMRASEYFQPLRHQRLDPQAQPVDASRTIAGELFSVDRFGIRFQRDFRLVDQQEDRRDGVQQLGDLVRSEERRSSPTEVDRADRTSSPAISHQREFAAHGREIAGDQRFLTGVDVEIAIGADPPAKRYVHVQPPRCLAGLRCSELELYGRLDGRHRSVIQSLAFC